MAFRRIAGASQWIPIDRARRPRQRGLLSGAGDHQGSRGAAVGLGRPRRHLAPRRRQMDALRRSLAQPRRRRGRPRLARLSEEQDSSTSTGDAVREFSAGEGLDLGNVMSIHAARAGRLGRRRARPCSLRRPALSRRHAARRHAVAERLRHRCDARGRSVAEHERRRNRRSPPTKCNACRQIRATRFATELFDFLDGMPGTPNAMRPLPSIAAGTDGRLWFATSNGIVWIDPQHIRSTTRSRRTSKCNPSWRTEALSSRVRVCSCRSRRAICRSTTPH